VVLGILTAPLKNLVLGDSLGCEPRKPDHLLYPRSDGDERIKNDFRVAKKTLLLPDYSGEW
jgi:hypothetical protein